jgi:hypothetical protein
MGPDEATALLCRATRSDYELIGRLAGGETGAHEVRRTGDNVRFVLKWESTPATQVLRVEGVALAARLRTESGWPVPEQWTHHADGTLLILQEFMKGEPPAMVTDRMVDQLLAWHDARRDLVDPASSLPCAVRLIDTLRVGGPTYCRHQSLRQYDARTSALLDEIISVGTALAPQDLLGSDIVHWDLHPENLLAADEEISAVVDTDFCTTFDAGFDLVMLALTCREMPCAPGTRERLEASGVEVLPSAKRRAYLGHLFVRILDWPIRRRAPEEVERWLGIIDDVRAAGWW